MALTNMVGFSKAISSGLYPKLIFEQKSEYIEIMLKRTLLFTIPIVGMSIIFAKPGLWILNPLYIDGIYIVYIWAITQLIYTFESIYSNVLLGIEKVDVNFNAKLKDYLKSRLITVPTFYSIARLGYLSVLAVLFFFAMQSGFNELDTIFWWGIIGIIVDVIIVGVFWKMIVKKIHFNFPFKEVSKHILCTVITIIPLYFILNNYLEYHESIFQFIPNLIPYIFLYIGIYAGLILAIDFETRGFARSIIHEVKK